PGCRAPVRVGTGRGSSPGGSTRPSLVLSGLSRGILRDSPVSPPADRLGKGFSLAFARSASPTYFCSPSPWASVAPGGFRRAFPWRAAERLGQGNTRLGKRTALPLSNGAQKDDGPSVFPAVTMGMHARSGGRGLARPHPEYATP